MGWAGKLVQKLPTFRGIGTFVYVATNWKTISAERDEYRRQIKGREEWAKTALQQKDALHEMAEEQSRREVDVWRTRAEGTLKVAREAVETTKDLRAIVERMTATLEKNTEMMNRIISAWVDASLLLARVLQREGPLTRVLLLNSLEDFPRGLVERMLAKLPSPPPLNREDLKPPPSVGGMNVR